MVKTDDIEEPFFYFTITVRTAPIFGYLLQFEVEFKETQSGFGQLRVKVSRFYPTIWGKSETQLG